MYVHARVCGLSPVSVREQLFAVRQERKQRAHVLMIQRDMMMGREETKTMTIRNTVGSYRDSVV